MARLVGGLAHRTLLRPVAAMFAVCAACGCNVESTRAPESGEQNASAFEREPNAKPQLIVGRVLRAIAHPSGPDGRAGIHTELVLLTEPTLSTATQTTQTVRIWVPGGRVGRRLRVLSHQASFATNDRGVFVINRASPLAIPAARVLDADPADPLLELASGEQLRFSRLRERVRGVTP